MPELSDGNKSFIRQWKILKTILSEPFGKTVKDLSEDFQVSTKTIRRDLELLESVMTPFQIENEKHGEKRYSIQSILLTQAIHLSREEALAFYIGRKMMAVLHGSYFENCYDTGYGKIKRIMERDILCYAEKTSRFFITMEGHTKDSVNGKLVDDILLAMEESRIIEIMEEEPGNKNRAVFRLHPYYFASREGQLYLVGNQYQEGQINIYNLNSFHSVRIMKENFVWPENFNIKEWLEQLYYDK